MTIVKWDPFGNVSALQGRINRMFEEAFPRAASMEEDLMTCEWRPPVDIYETADGLVIVAELPGVVKENVSIEVKDNILTLRGERMVDAEVSDDQYYRRERACGIFNRAFTLFDNINPESIRAKFSDGILRITIPRPEEQATPQVKVNID